MFGSFSYLGLMLIFTLVPITILWLKNYRFLMQNLRVILIVMATAVVYQLIADPFAEAWHAWFFTRDKTLGVWLINFPIENIIFFALVSFTIASAILSMIHHYGLRRDRH